RHQLGQRRLRSPARCGYRRAPGADSCGLVGPTLRESGAAWHGDRLLVGDRDRRLSYVRGRAGGGGDRRSVGTLGDRLYRGPWPLGYHGLGELFVLIFFGFVAVCGTAFVQVGRVPESAWWSSLAVGSLATAILVVNNLRDRKTDRKAGKRTLAVRL